MGELLEERKTIIVVEGPAGSGKSLVCDHLKNAGLHLIERLPMPFRDYGRSEDPSLVSMIKDFYYLATALEDPNEVVVLDRFFLSQQVYQALRSDSCSLIPVSNKYLADQAEMIRKDYLLRARRITPFSLSSYHLRVRFLFLLLIPSFEDLIRNRSGSGKDYPFDPHSEIALYQDVFIRASYDHLLQIKKISAPTGISPDELRSNALNSVLEEVPYALLPSESRS